MPQPDPTAGPPQADLPHAIPDDRAAPPVPDEQRRRWHAYYTDKRILHQWFQVHLLRDLPVTRVLEVGPYWGLVTSMLANAGYTVTTLDVSPMPPPLGAAGHVQADIRALRPEQCAGHDVIIACEVLEHIHWPQVDAVLAAMAGSGTPWLILSVPYEGTQFGLTLYLNRHVFRRRSFLRKFRFLKRFRIRDHEDFDAHKWEVGYRETPLSALRDKVQAAGWRIARQDFTADCRSVFLVCRNAGPDADSGGPAAAAGGAATVAAGPAAGHPSR